LRVAIHARYSAEDSRAGLDDALEHVLSRSALCGLDANAAPPLEFELYLFLRVAVDLGKLVG
jgi:hypothetical protein